SRNIAAKKSVFAIGLSDNFYHVSQNIHPEEMELIYYFQNTTKQRGNSAPERGKMAVGYEITMAKNCSLIVLTTTASCLQTARVCGFWVGTRACSVPQGVQIQFWE